LIQKQNMNTQVDNNSFDLVWNYLENRHGYDFSEYSRSTIDRRIGQFMTREKLSSPTELMHKLMADKMFHVKMTEALTVNFTEMFRDASFFLSLTRKVLPFLSTYPSIKIWHAGCSTGEEVYSLAILLDEFELLHKTKIYATDMNETCLKAAERGIYSFEQIKNYTKNYRASGGRKDFSMYYEAQDNGVKLNAYLKKNITFFQHNLATDHSFNEFHLILCRNVLIYFNRNLQTRVVDLFKNSLNNLGYLAIGNKENLLFNGQRNNFAFIDREEKIYRKVQFIDKKL